MFFIFFDWYCCLPHKGTNFLANHNEVELEDAFG